MMSKKLFALMLVVTMGATVTISGMDAAEGYWAKTKKTAKAGLDFVTARPEIKRHDTTGSFMNPKNYQISNNKYTWKNAATQASLVAAILAALGLVGTKTKLGKSFRQNASAWGKKAVRGMSNLGSKMFKRSSKAADVVPS